MGGRNGGGNRWRKWRRERMGETEGEMTGGGGKQRKGVGQSGATASLQPFLLRSEARKHALGNIRSDQPRLYLLACSSP